MDRIIVDNLEVFAHHGLFPEENENGQKFYVNAKLYTDTREAGIKDDLTKSTHYGEVCHSIYRFMTEHTYQLIETVAEKVAEVLPDYVHPRYGKTVLELLEELEKNGEKHIVC